MTRWLARVLLALLLGVAMVAALATGGSAQDSEEGIQILDLSEDEAGFVTFEVALPAELGEVALTSTNFTVTENAQRREVEIIPFSDVVDVVVALDTSGSMAGGPIEAAKAAAATFIESLPPQARVGIVSFGTTVDVRVPPDEERSSALEAVAGLQAEAEGGTALWDALGRSAQLVADLGTERPYVVILSDGVDEGSVGGQSSAVAEFTAADAGLYAIALEGTDQAALEQIASAVGGQVLEASDETQLVQVYDDIASRLSNRYTVRYQTTPDVERVIVIAVAADEAVATARIVVPPSGGATPGEPSAAVAEEQPVGSDQLVQSEPLALPIIEGRELGLLSSPETLAFGVGAFFLVFMLIGVIVAIPASEIRVDVSSGADRVAAARNSLTNATERLLRSSVGGGRFDRALDLSGVNLRSGEFAMLALAGTALLFLAVSFLAGLVLAVAAPDLFMNSLRFMCEGFSFSSPNSLS